VLLTILLDLDGVLSQEWLDLGPFLFSEHRHALLAAPTVVPLSHKPALSVRRRLTVKLSGRAEAPDQRRGRTLSAHARGAYPQVHHGLLQRWLEGATTHARSGKKLPRTAAEIPPMAKSKSTFDAMRAGD
jgi:hypothetical protein